MDLKQLELDTAAAKVDELSKQLESLWTDHPGPPVVPSLVNWELLGGELGVLFRGNCSSATRLPRAPASPVPSKLGRGAEPFSGVGPGCSLLLGQRSRKTSPLGVSRSLLSPFG
ncbi:RelA-associated inhibitor, partial [Ophiophagus hannah]